MLSESPKPSLSKVPVIRGARACTVCRAAKMKCVGAEDGNSPCQRCKRSNTECIFEKHRRGRKPGSKLSEASKMLRKLEKGLNNAKMKSQTMHSQPSAEPNADGLSDAHIRLGQFNSPDGRQYREPDMRQSMYNGAPADRPYNGHVSGSSSLEDDDNDGEPADEGMYPARLIKKERQRNSFFGTVLGPSGSAPMVDNGCSASTPSTMDRSPSYSTDRPLSVYGSPQIGAPLDDPVRRGLMDESTAENIFDMVLIRLNPFVNLFDPELHTAAYVRKKCPFLFTTLLMAGSKFFRPHLYPECRQLAEQHAVKAFAESRKSVEIVQAFMCLTYWKEYDDARTWTYIGFACRMAVELNLNRYAARPSPGETNMQRLERRNRERTYLVLFVHDRSLSMQTGRLWMLPEDDLVIESYNWHEQVPPGTNIRPEDVILAAFVSLRQIGVETTKMFELQRGTAGGQQDNFDFLLNACNMKLAAWAATWTQEMKRAHGESFHHSFLEFFQLYVGLFLNSFGIHAYMTGTNDPPPSLQALGTCFANASRCLEIIVKEFARVQMLQYSQESVTTMTAYCAVMLLRLLRKSGKADSNNVFALILNAAEAYREAGTMMPSSSSFIFHARFLRSLVEREQNRAHQIAAKERQVNAAIDPALRDVSMGGMNHSNYPLPITPGPDSASSGQTSPLVPTHPSPPIPTGESYPYFSPPANFGHGGQVLTGPGDKGMVDSQVYANGNVGNHTQQQADHLYYHTMCRELGVTEGGDLMGYNMMYFRDRGVA